MKQMPRYKLTIEYDGTRYYGWQTQEGLPTVQETLENALAQFADHPVATMCAGRTDAGVHARGQVVHVDFESARKPFNIIRGVNIYLLPHPVVVVAAEEVADDFHARFMAKSRSYQYRIVHREGRLGLDELRAWHIYRPMDVDAMREAASYLLGEHDFNSFRSTECCAKSSIKSVEHIDIVQNGDDIFVNVTARSFMHNQVRIMVGSLAQVAIGKWKPEKIKEMLAAKDRRSAGITAPAHGLYFMKVEY